MMDELYADGQYVRRTRDQRAIAICATSGSIEEDKANARLFAQSVALREAAERVCTEMPSTQNIGRWRDEFTRIFRLIDSDPKEEFTLIDIEE